MKCWICGARGLRLPDDLHTCVVVESPPDPAMIEIARLRAALAESQAREAALREAARALLGARRDTLDARETADGAFLTPAQDAERGLRRIFADPSREVACTCGLDAALTEEP